jgi:hypothetical protein
MAAVVVVLQVGLVAEQLVTKETARSGHVQLGSAIAEKTVPLNTLAKTI